MNIFVHPFSCLFVQVPKLIAFASMIFKLHYVLCGHLLVICYAPLHLKATRLFIFDFLFPLFHFCGNSSHSSEPTLGPSTPLFVFLLFTRFTLSKTHPHNCHSHTILQFHPWVSLWEVQLKSGCYLMMPTQIQPEHLGMSGLLWFSPDFPAHFPVRAHQNPSTFLFSRRDLW